MEEYPRQRQSKEGTGKLSFQPHDFSSSSNNGYRLSGSIWIYRTHIQSIYSPSSYLLYSMLA